jgi:hypothetical protein
MLLLPTISRTTYNEDSGDNTTVGVLSVAVNVMLVESLLSFNREWFYIWSDKRAPVAQLTALGSTVNTCTRSCELVDNPRSPPNAANKAPTQVLARPYSVSSSVQL